MNKKQILTLLLLITTVLFACGQAENKNASSTKKEVKNRPKGFLETGWYYVSNEKTEFKRQLDKTEEMYFINPKVAVPVEQFKKLELTESQYEGKSVPMLVIYFDDKGTANWKTATSYNGKMALIVNNRLVITSVVFSTIVNGVSALSRIDYTSQDVKEISKEIEKQLQE